MRRAAVILDRDGTILREREYLSSPDEVELLPNAAEGLYRLREAGVPLVVVTNQSGVGRGYFTSETVTAVHDRMRELLRREGVELNGIYVCPHTPADGCACRKPGTALADRAAEDLQLDLDQSFVIGDKPCDIDLGRNIGARTILVLTGYGEQHRRERTALPDRYADDLADAAQWILGLPPVDERRE